MSETDTPAPSNVDPAAAATPTPTEPSVASEQNQAGVPEAVPAPSATDINATATTTSDDDGFLGGKYKSKDEFEAAYKELKNTYDSTQHEKAELSRILADAFAAEPVVPSVPQVPDYDDFSQNQPASNPADDTVTKKLALMEFAMGHPDANGEVMVEILKKDPTVNQIPNYEAKLNYAYAISKTQMQPKAIEAAQKQAQVDAQVKIAEKQAAQVESASRQSPAPDTNQSLTPQQIHDTMNNDDAFAELIKKQFPGIASMTG